MFMNKIKIEKETWEVFEKFDINLKNVDFQLINNRDID